MTTSQPSLQNLISAMDFVSLLKQEKEVNQKLASIVPGTEAYTQAKGILVQKLSSTYQEQGIKADEQTINDAVDNYLQSTINETNPEKNPLLPLNPIGVNWIKANVGLGLLWTIINWVKTISITAVLLVASIITITAISTYNAWDAQRLPNSIADINKISIIAANEIPTIEATQQRLKEQTEALVAKSGLDSAIVERVTGMKEAQTIVTALHTNREDTVRMAKTAVETSNTLSSAQIALKQVEAYYMQGTEAFKQVGSIDLNYRNSIIPRLLLSAKTNPEIAEILKSAAGAPNLQERIQIANRLEQAAQLEAQKEQSLEQVATTIANIEKNITDPVALILANNMAQAAKKAADNGNIQQAEHNLNNIEALQNIINTPATLQIVSRQGQKSGATRFAKDVGSNGGDYAYVIVELVDANGNAIAYPIKDEETQQTKWVSMWGERVSRAAYDALKSEKISTGRIANTQFGGKAVGKFTPSYNAGPKAGTSPTLTPENGRIISW